MAKKTVTHTADTTTTPTGVEGMRVTCDCGTHRNPAAIITATMYEQLNTMATGKGDNTVTTMVHNIIGLANTPLARTQSAQATGPWTA
jgi:hypothetical protein